MSRNIHCTYISEKVNKIRWRPNVFNDPTTFVTASWDNDSNHVRLWEIKGQNSDEEADINPYEINVLPFQGDITELKFLDSDYLIASSSRGSVFLLKIATSLTDEISITEEISWEKLHSFPDFESSCTSFAIYDNDIVTVGEDGKMHLLNTKSTTPTQTIEDADSCTVTCVQFLKYNEVLTANIRGQMKIWDLRGKPSKASSVFMLNGDNIVSATCLAYHPTQRHIVAAGDEQGSLTIWDLRQNTYPLNVVTSHPDSVSEVQFHPDRPEQLFSCSEAGEVFHWTGIKQANISFEQEPWFMSSAGSNKYDIFVLMPQLHCPINTIDLNRDRLLCGGDNEAMYLIEGVNIYK